MPASLSPLRIAIAAVVLALPAAYAVAVYAKPGGYRIDESSDPTFVPLPRRSASSADLREYRWQVQLATRADGNALPLLQADALDQIYLQFGPDRMSFSGGANEISMYYQVDGSRIASFVPTRSGLRKQGGGFVSTAVGTWSERPLAMDQLLSAHLAPPFEHWLEGSGTAQRLHLIGADGTHFILQTTDAAYGAKGERVNLEIAAGLKRCSTGCGPLNAPRPDCVSARKLRWANGGPQPASEWFTLPRHAFDGRRMQDNQHQVLETRHYPSLSGKQCSVGIYVVDYVSRYEDIARTQSDGLTTATTATAAP
ncbi:hypothetical protein [Lysobacter enzymogenes]|uniref:hypothetical protein n=1 Tax=Lysobacter enzymogenes TaxID=69 RepID=UPI001AF2431B|nr:hypothetical protein [Lysobacter enzymogenes]QQQ01568.1 hypothetical protein JHW41_00860 [Lysobacter enzymogenes]